VLLPEWSLRRDRVNLTADVDSDDVGARLGQPHCVAAPLAARRPGDDSDPAVEPSHRLSSVVDLCER
jgi:hypothetical protein